LGTQDVTKQLAREIKKIVERKKQVEALFSNGFDNGQLNQETDKINKYFDI